MKLDEMTLADLKASRDFVLECIADQKELNDRLENERIIQRLEILHKKLRDALFYRVMALHNSD